MNVGRLKTGKDHRNTTGEHAVSTLRPLPVLPSHVGLYGGRLLPICCPTLRWPSPPITVPPIRRLGARPDTTPGLTVHGVRGVGAAGIARAKPAPAEPDGQDNPSSVCFMVRAEVIGLTDTGSLLIS
jgi:hypothetical protein